MFDGAGLGGPHGALGHAEDAGDLLIGQVGQAQLADAAAAGRQVGEERPEPAVVVGRDREVFG
ncbi:MAG TPA: hypothetical protein VH482_19885 [Thermomicrobiales bacterium]